jgi:hypothetical protein
MDDKCLTKVAPHIMMRLRCFVLSRVGCQAWRDHLLPAHQTLVRISLIFLYHVATLLPYIPRSLPFVFLLVYTGVPFLLELTLCISKYTALCCSHQP